MNPLYSNKIYTYFNDAKMIKKGQMPDPRMALIYPTYACNHKCPHCLYAGWNTGKHFEYKRLRSLITELADNGIKAIEFCGGGEPTLYPKFKQIVSHIRKNNIDFGLLTNGSMLHKYGKFLVDNATYIRISLDSLNPETYKKMHGVEIGHLVQVINDLIDYRNKTKSKCVIGVKRILSEINKDEAFSFDKADYVEEKYARACNGGLKDKKSKLVGKCWLSPIHTMIDAYGDVYICCYYQYRKQTHKFGNIFKDSFYHIWYSDEHYKAIKGIKTKECNKYDCRFHRYNKVMRDLSHLHINFI
jgi:MoaA/NifB/PqqE/SkfB family radical SAM enzyme